MSANPMPPLREAEYGALKKSIQEYGVLQPIEVDEETGELLDGYHRNKIGRELGIEVPVVKKKPPMEAAEYSITVNLKRRHLGPIAWAESFKKLAELRGLKLGRGGDRKSTANVAVDSAEDLAKEVGVNPRTARYRLQLADDLKDEADLAEKVDAGDMEAKRALRLKREREAAERADANREHLTVTEYKVEDVDIRCCDFRDLDLPETSVDLIFTDPPYPAEYLPLWADLSHFAASALKPGGLLLAYSGQYHLPKVMDSLALSLDYVWLGCLLLSSEEQCNKLHRPAVRSMAKPMLFYKKPGDDVSLRWVSDCHTSEGQEKEHHVWQQSMGAALYYIERLSDPQSLIVDPFVGGGTTPVAAKRLKRTFIGCDIDPLAVDTARKRVADE